MSDAAALPIRPPRPIPPAALSPAPFDPSAVADLPGIPGGWSARVFECNGRSFPLTVPAEPDAFLDDPDVLAANRRDDYMPYWGYLWPACAPLTAAVLASDWPSGASALEIGCGIGLVGVAALARGLNVTVSDYDESSVALAVHNARRNGFNAEPLQLDWRHPAERRFSVILGSDITYEIRNHEPILDVLDAMLAPAGVCWIGDAGRQISAGFLPLARRRGYQVQLFNRQGNPIDEPTVGEFQLFILRR